MLSSFYHIYAGLKPRCVASANSRLPRRIFSTCSIGILLLVLIFLYEFEVFYRKSSILYNICILDTHLGPFCCNDRSTCTCGRWGHTSGSGFVQSGKCKFYYDLSFGVASIGLKTLFWICLRNWGLCDVSFSMAFPSFWLIRLYHMPWRI